MQEFYPADFRRKQLVHQAPCPSFLFTVQAERLFLLPWGLGEEFFLFSLFFRYGNAMPTDGAVQSRDRSLWQSVEKAADEHGILIIKHNER